MVESLLGCFIGYIYCICLSLLAWKVINTILVYFITLWIQFTCRIHFSCWTRVQASQSKTKSESEIQELFHLPITVHNSVICIEWGEKRLRRETSFLPQLFSAQSFLLLCNICASHVSLTAWHSSIPKCWIWLPLRLLQVSLPYTTKMLRF